MKKKYGEDFKKNAHFDIGTNNKDIKKELNKWGIIFMGNILVANDGSSLNFGKNANAIKKWEIAAGKNGTIVYVTFTNSEGNEIRVTIADGHINSGQEISEPAVKSQPRRRSKR